MQPFEHVHGIAAPMREADINTDQIVPGRFMHKVREDYGRYCFHDLRFDPQGRPRAGFVLNQPAFAGASVLVAGANFGCGSSREHAVFTLADYGFRAILAPGFGDIFFNNCFQNGVLPVVLPADFVEHLFACIEAIPRARIAVDLPRQQVTAPDGRACGFDIDAFRKHCLLEGLDDIDVTLSMAGAIDRFEQTRQTRFP
ncbi:3-isopropylmalate dehydratase small subunit [Cupriavidus basilensis]|uniref:3-isopropylmalate dehydratase small subunit n=1 Tax=Cupriavidus basilensis TaxID=68895 RepID=UPI0007508311|nr:3-isopropylmalate dehydratase small subunit [Cupriavidus basilensis]